MSKVNKPQKSLKSKKNVSASDKAADTELPLTKQAQGNDFNLDKEFGWKTNDKKEFWKRIVKSIGADPRPESSIKGQSGMEHSLLGMGVDDKNQRVILVSSETDSRFAALMQTDVQATFSADTKVILVRPVTASLTTLAKVISLQFGGSEIDLGKLGAVFSGLTSGQGGQLTPEGQRFFKEILVPLFRPYYAAPLSALSEISQVIRSLSQIEFSTTTLPGQKEELGILKLQQLLKEDPLQTDISLGICGFPLFNFTHNHFDTVLDGGKDEEIAVVLKDLGIYQYFFPPVDQAVLGLCDRFGDKIGNLPQVIEQIPLLGHPLSPSELVDEGVSIVDVIDALQARGLKVEGEVELTPEGVLQRQQVRFRPREGLFSKISIRLSNYFIFK